MATFNGDAKRRTVARVEVVGVHRARVNLWRDGDDSWAWFVDGLTVRGQPRFPDSVDGGDGSAWPGSLTLGCASGYATRADARRAAEVFVRHVLRNGRARVDPGVPAGWRLRGTWQTPGDARPFGYLWRRFDFRRDGESREVNIMARSERDARQALRVLLPYLPAARDARDLARSARALAVA